MGLTKWLRARRLRSLREQACVVQAEIDNYAYIARQTGYYYPTTESRNARELARIRFRIAEIEALNGPDNG
jgi:hypothetical protein